MPVQNISQEIGTLVEQARAEGVAAGYDQARRDFYGQNAAFLLGNIFADAMEAAAGWVAPHDQRFASALTMLAGEIRQMVTPPTVLGTVPAADAAAAPLDQVISVRFSMDMAPEDFTPANVFVYPSGGGGHLAAESVSYDAPSRTATLRLANGLSGGTSYEAHVENLHSAAGVGMDPFTWSFVATSEPA